MSYKNSVIVCLCLFVLSLPYGKCAAANMVPGIPPPIDANVVEERPGYNSWPMIQNIGSRVICAYSRGMKHTIHDGERDTFAKYSDDNGVTWSRPFPIAARPTDGEVVIGKGLDSKGAALFWIRCFNKRGRCHELYRTLDGESWTLVTTLSNLKPNPMQITDIFPVPNVGLMAFWFATDYKHDATNNFWGVMTSPDDGATWHQQAIESNIPLSELPAEQCGVYIGDGKILALGRTQAAGNQFQITSSDYGKTWKKSRTNISDINLSTPSLIYDQKTGIVRNYYYWRGHRQLRLRTADAAIVFANPNAWSEPVKVANGNETQVSWDAGNVNVTSNNYGDFAAYYSGTNSYNTSIYVKILPHGKNK